MPQDARRFPSDMSALAVKGTNSYTSLRVRAIRRTWLAGCIHSHSYKIGKICSSVRNILQSRPLQIPLLVANLRSVVQSQFPCHMTSSPTGASCQCLLRLHSSFGQSIKHGTGSKVFRCNWSLFFYASSLGVLLTKCNVFN